VIILADGLPITLVCTLRTALLMPLLYPSLSPPCFFPPFFPPLISSTFSRLALSGVEICFHQLALTAHYVGKDMKRKSRRILKGISVGGERDGEGREGGQQSGKDTEILREMETMEHVARHLETSYSFLYPLSPASLPCPPALPQGMMGVGTTTAVMGPSGCGKSSLLHSLAG